MKEDSASLHEGGGIALHAESRHKMTSAEKRVIFASSMGTIFELYDFFLVGALSVEIARHFFSGVNPSAGFILTLLGFAAGFVMRPFGGMVFGSLGDLIGRKRTFLTTILIMGGATFIIGCLPGYEAIGLLSPALFVLMRMMQGLAIGGEFGGAFIYVAEHGPQRSRGERVAWVVATGAGGFLLSLLVVSSLRFLLGEPAFGEWGWRLPFIFSILILLVSLWIRLKLDESPEFLRIKAEGNMSKAPVAETLGQWANLRLVLIAIFGVMMGTVILFYNAQLYTMFFLTKALKIDPATTNTLIIVATLLTAPLYILFGKCSDLIGPRRVLIAACLLGAAFTMPLFMLLTHYANPALEKAQREAPITVAADFSQCAFQFDPTGTAKFSSSCDIITSTLARAGLNYRSEDLPSGQIASIRIGDETIEGYSASDPDASKKAEQFRTRLAAALAKSGYGTASASAASMNVPMILLILMALLCLGAMSFTSSVTMLIGMFPTRIRYTAISVPYHFASAVFGGFLPAISFAAAAATGDIYAGLWYVSGASFLSVIVLLIFTRNEGRRGEI